MIAHDRLRQYAFYLFYSGLIVLVISMPLSKFGMSISQFMIAGGWLLSGDLSSKFKKFLSSRIALAIVSIYIMHLLGLLYTTDFQYAFKDLRIKLPLLILPLLLSTAPAFSMKQFERILMAVIAGVTASTIISFMVYMGIINRPVVDIRDITIFISHIRLALLCCLSIFISGWLLYQHRYDDKFRIYLLILVPVSLWLFYFLFLIQSLTGIVIIGFVVLSAFLYLLLTKGNTILKFVMFLSIAVIISLLAFKFNNVLDVFTIKEEFNSIVSDEKTALGNNYIHSGDLRQYENGYLVWAYVNEQEMESEWNSRSEIKYHSKDHRGQEIRFTLIRFLTSKGFKKDAEGVSRLAPKEISAIENGIANVYYLESGPFNSRLHTIIWEINNLQTGQNPSGHSLAQRFEYWNAAILIIMDHPVIGTGTGDVIHAFESKYEFMNSPLSKEWRLRSHNQYLAIGVAFGIAGLIWFLFVLFYLIKISIKRGDFLYVMFALTAMISMLTEDTLETQAGITFFALFTCLFLFINPQNSSVGGNPHQ